MTWIVFANQAAFDAWHDLKCQERGIPVPGFRQSDGLVQLGNQWTTSYVRPVIIGGVLVADVPDLDATVDKLTPISAPLAALIAKAADFVVPTRIDPVSFMVDRPLPATWIIDNQSVLVPARR